VTFVGGSHPGGFKFRADTADISVGQDHGDGRAVDTVDTRRGANRMDLFVVRTWLSARLTKSDRGATMVEYILLVALIALAVIAAVVFLRDQMSTKFDEAGSTVSRLPNP
jgi:Flp pilus assembly pilin Flp